MYESVRPIEQFEWIASDLAASFPPRFTHPHKARLFTMSRFDEKLTSHSVAYARWPMAKLPDRVPSDEDRSGFVPVAGHFDYQPRGTSGSVHVWTMNFADPHLFVAYAGSLMAQDELQVAEIPLLACIPEAVHAETGQLPTTEGATGPTPVTIRGVNRLLHVHTEPTELNPAGLYGNRFAASPWKKVEPAIEVLDPPQPANILAMAAPACGYGEYEPEEIEHILQTAYTGFTAAKAMTRQHNTDVECEIHTGFWGCGAFGGNRELMARLQILAAWLAEVDRLCFFGFDGQSAVRLAEVMSDCEELTTRSDSTLALIDTIAERGYEWGVSDGN